MGRLTLIINPVASSVTRQRASMVRSALARAGDVTVVETERREHATELARRAAQTGVGAVVVLGGDGAVNEVANGLAGTETALAPLPGGSTNVYARTLGYDRRLSRAVDQLLDALSAGWSRRLALGLVDSGSADVGPVEERRFCFHAGLGFDAAVVEWVDGRPSFLKRHAASPLFVSGTAETWRRTRNLHSLQFDLELDGETIVEGVRFAIVSNTSPYTFLGRRRMLVAPGGPAEGALALTALTSLTLRALTGAIGSALGTAKKLQLQENVEYRPEVKTLTLRAEEPVPYQVDGEYLGRATELRFTCEPESLKVISPEKAPDQR